MPSHSIFSPSSADRWGRCPGSILAEKAEPEEEAGPAAKEGNLAHEYAAALLLGTGRPEGVDGEMKVHITGYRDIAIKLAKDIGAEDYHVEERVAIPTIHKECFGTCDFVATSKDGRLVLLDLKYGFGIRSAFENYQLVAYALGFDGDGDVTLAIYQPRAFRPYGPLDTWTLSREGLRVYGEILKRSAELAFTAEPPLMTGPHCRYCAAAYRCEALRSDALAWCEYTLTANTRHAEDGGELWILEKAAEIIKYRIAAIESHSFATGKAPRGFEIYETRGKKVFSEVSEKQLREAAKAAGVLITKEVFITPNQAIEAGLPADVVEKFARRNPGKKKLRKSDDKYLQEVFK